MGSLSEQTLCGHMIANGDDHRCPDCGGVLRRCCQSTTLTPHVEGCEAVKDHMARRRGTMNDREDSEG
jgi:predicted RNA-binding Zn-ribbon protein involved in translation (DUF1610 family)